MAKYVDLEIIHVSVDNSPEAKPWLDGCLVARKKGNSPEDVDKLLKQINDLENQIQTIKKNI